MVGRGTQRVPLNADLHLCPGPGISHVVAIDIQVNEVIGQGQSQPTRAAFQLGALIQQFQLAPRPTDDRYLPLGPPRSTDPGGSIH